MNDEQIYELVNDIYDPRIEKCDSEYRQEMTRLYVRLALQEGIRIGREGLKERIYSSLQGWV